MGIGLGNLCNENDRERFVAAMISMAMLVNGERVKFWNSCWLHGIQPKKLFLDKRHDIP
jgi:hypothetical protein